MSGDDKTPDFNWLKQGIGNPGKGPKEPTPPAAGPIFPAPPFRPPQFAETFEGDLPLEEDSESFLNDDDIPPPVPNASDGSTLILRDRDLNPGGILSGVSDATPDEDFSSPNSTSDEPPSTDPSADEESVSLAAEEVADHETTDSNTHSDTDSDAEMIADDAGVETEPEVGSEVGTFDEQTVIEPKPEATLEGSTESSSETSSDDSSDSGEEKPKQCDPKLLSDTVIVEPVILPHPETTTEGTLGETPEKVLSSPPTNDSGKTNESSGFSPAIIGAGAAVAASPFGSSLSFGNDEPSGSSRPSQKASGKKEATGPTSGKGRLVTIFLAMYAVTITLAFLLMLIKDLTQTFRPHQLESLPDLPSEKAENLSYVPANMKLPRGHSIPLGQQQRFGNILIEPIKITEEPLEFVHYSGNPKRVKPPSDPAWKLWLKVTNVSDSQTIAPLDRQLVLRWISKAKQNRDFTNQYITSQGATSRAAESVQLYRLPTQGDWDLKDQELGKELKPGESYITYLASNDEGFEKLKGSLVWRVQIRKGYSPKGHGVTTIFEVPFRKEDVIHSDSSESAQAPMALMKQDESTMMVLRDHG